MPIDRYIMGVRDALDRLQSTQTEAIGQAAEMVTEAIADEQKVFAFGATHSFILCEEMVYRTGGLMLINPIYPQGMNLSVRPMTMTSQLERLEGFGETLLHGSAADEGDVLIIASTSGRNAVALDMALAARAKGIKTIGITAMEYSQNVVSRHSSGKRLFELVDLVIDTCSPLGDAAVGFEGFPQKSGPLSSVMGCAVVNSLVCQVIQNLLDRGLVPPVFISANVEGGDEHNAKVLADNAGRIFYME